MYTVHVHVQVKPEVLEYFCQATVQNATNSLLETGVVRFDVFQEIDDQTRFVLVEVYRTEEDANKHKETDHYKIWRDKVEGMMAEPRRGIKYKNVFPEDESWR
jgi:(4S)-4-hydroxy-5-phosphonooxypentane-2,3-dione isomerase